MKKIVLALALVGGTLASNAQVYLGGKLGLWGTKDVKTEVTLAPEIGYKLSNNTAIGTSISYTLDDPKGDKNNSSVFEFNPYLRYTACRVGAVSFIVDGALGFNWASKENVSGSKFGWSVGVRPVSPLTSTATGTSWPASVNSATASATRWSNTATVSAPRT